MDIGIGVGLASRLRASGVGGPASFLLSPPAGLGWTPSWSVRKTGSVYDTTVTFDALQPAAAITYYCSPAGSAAATPVDNDPATPITPRRAVTLANANGGVVRLKLAGGRYYGNIGFDGNNLTNAGLILEAWTGQGTGRPVFIKRGTNLVAPWTLDQGTTWYTAHAVANTPVFDLKSPTASGLYSRLTAAADLATCRATPGSYFYDSAASRMYVTASDGRSLSGDLDMIVTTSGNVFVLNNAVDQNIWIGTGVDFIGAVSLAQTGTGKKTIWSARDTGYFGGTNAAAWTGPMDVINLSPRVGGGNSDGLNYHGNAAGDVRALEYDVRSIRSGYDASGANNATTAHENCRVISVGGDYAGSQNRTMADINTSKRWAVGSTIRASLAADASAITVAAYSGTSEIWLDDCHLENSVTAALWADTGCAIHTANMSLAGLTLGGTGTINTYTP